MDIDKKSKAEQEAIDKWWDEHTSDPDVVEQQFKNSPKSEGEMGMAGCLIRPKQGANDYQGDGTEWIYEQDEDGKIFRRMLGSDNKERL